MQEEGAVRVRLSNIVIDGREGKDIKNNIAQERIVEEGPFRSIEGQTPQVTERQQGQGKH